jgi:hypothetical protein
LDHDDDFVSVELPFTIGSHGQSTVWVSVNGGVSVNSGADAFNNEQLPTNDLPSESFLAYWDDLYLKRSRGDGIFYEVSTGSLGRQVTFEWVIGRAVGTNIFPFSAIFYETNPNTIKFLYYTTPDKRSSATIGTQNGASFRQHSFNQMYSVPDGTTVMVDTNGVITTGVFDNSECGKE